MAARVAALALLALAVAGCADGGGGGVVPERDAEGRYVVLLTADNTFEPADARVPLGSTVVWRVVGANLHDVDGYAPGEDYSTVSSMWDPPRGLGRLMAEGEEFEATLDRKGTWLFFCHNHHYEEMKGRIRVG